MWEEKMIEHKIKIDHCVAEDDIYRNHTDEWNISVMVHRFNEGNKKVKYRQFLDSITMDANLCNLMYNTYEIGMYVFEYRLNWLVAHGYCNIRDYLEKNRKNIPKEFKRVANALIREKKNEIKQIKKGLCPPKNEERKAVIAGR